MSRLEVLPDTYEDDTRLLTGTVRNMESRQLSPEQVQDRQLSSDSEELESERARDQTPEPHRNDAGEAPDGQQLGGTPLLPRTVEEIEAETARITAEVRRLKAEKQF